MTDLLLVFAAAALAVLMRRLVLTRLDADAGAERVAPADMLTALLEMAVLIIAFIMVASFQTWSNAGDVAGEEADRIVAMSQHASFLPDQASGPLVADLTCYARSVEHHEWPAMRIRQSSTVSAHWLERLGSNVERDADVRGAERFVELQSALVADRRARLNDALPSVPRAMYLFMVLTVLLTIFGMTLFTNLSPRQPGHAILLLATIVILGSALVLTRDLDSPYTGASRTEPTAIHHAQRELARELERYDVAPPCNAKGTPFDTRVKVATTSIA